MSSKKQSEELQSRREFFKKAAKATLPVIGMSVVSGIPFVEMYASSSKVSSCVFGCSGGC